MRRRHQAGKALAVVLAAVTLATLAGAGIASAAKPPEVISRTSQDFITIPTDPDPSPLFTMRVPTGRWVAWVVVRYGVFDEVIWTPVTCWTAIVGPGELDRHTVRAKVSNLSTSEVQGNLAMSVTNPRGARVTVSCRGCGVTVARDIRIVAMRAGTLTRVTPIGTASWGSGSPT